MNYENYILANDQISLNKLIKNLNENSNKLSFFEIQVKPGSRSNLGRPTTTPKQNKIDLMSKINELSKRK